MAVSGFEGFEKRLELQFSSNDPKFTLRQIDFFAVEKVLHAVQCTVVSAVGNKFFDSYVLSESSLFIYPSKIIIKTCGTTQLLKSVRPFADLAAGAGLKLSRCRYTRGSFIFPDAQPYPHTSFEDEVNYLNQSLPENFSGKSAVMDTWNVFTASDGGAAADDGLYTVEICMTQLDIALARKFFRRRGDGRSPDAAGMEMTAATGIRDVNRKALICDYAFDPCGYSMNGLDGNRYSTVHVTPEDGFSYASFECVAGGRKNELAEILQKVVKIFRPAELSVATTSAGGCDAWLGVAEALKPMGMRLRRRAAEEFPAAGTVVFQTLTTRRN
ncbi:S-adenosylmethionine decarboxylase proenzyme 4-like [Andrographis paniculata]|uniref:S-adenosylmethionine decarboxylase proenzyme 4-like n=1 Tax=Andrographis paniculata TaxID=175694 RepID=UPI0021E8FFF4|nr:S-adenosylmethionine decarboxylase proenzyme 4-like [Andrographis paniculata]